MALIHRIEPAGRLVENQHAGVARKRQGDHDGRAHALRKRATAFPRLDAEVAEQLERALGIELRERAPVHFDVLGDRHPLVQRAALGHVGDVLERFGNERLAVVQNLAAGHAR